MMFRAAFGPGVEVGVIAARPSFHDPQRWWKTSLGTKLVLGESISLVWTACCFWPPPAGSHEERWAVPLSRGANAAATSTAPAPSTLAADKSP